MFDQTDYQAFFQQLYDVEMAMRHEGHELLKLIHEPRSVEIIQKIIADEERHAKIVQEMMKLIK